MKEKIEKLKDKKFILIIIFLVLIMIILFGGAIIYNKFFYKKSLSEIETIMVDSSKAYYQENKEELPKELNETVKIEVDDLVKDEKMKSIQEYLKDENTNCDGYVNVTNINGKYRYVPFLNCGKMKQTQRFIDYIQKKVPIVETGNGLYNLNDEFVYRGDEVNNYIKLSSKIYRIVKFTNDYTVIIYTDNDKLESRNWDDRYNIEKEEPIGINNYSVSRIKDYLDSLYESKTLLTAEDKLLVSSYHVPIGKRKDNDTDKSGNLEKATLLENKFIGLLPVYDFLNASIDVNCTTTTSKSCTNYNYLAKYKFNWWTSTATSDNSYKVYRIEQSPNQTNAYNNAYVRPVLYLAKDIIYVSGNGTSKSPYIVK